MNWWYFPFSAGKLTNTLEHRFYSIMAAFSITPSTQNLRAIVLFEHEQFLSQQIRVNWCADFFGAVVGTIVCHLNLSVGDLSKLFLK